MTDNKTPSLILAAAPTQKIQLPDSFYEKEGAFFNLLRNPASLRYVGWNLRTLDTPRLRNGEYWEVKNGERKLLRLYSDGSFIAVASVGRDFLGWRQEENPPVLHLLGAIEFIYEFAELYRIILKHVLDMGLTVRSCRFKVGIKDLQSLSETLKLMPSGSILSHELGEKYDLESDFIKEAEPQTFTDRIYDPQYVACTLVGILFRQFGAPLNTMPYTKLDEMGRRFIDVEKIKAIS